MENLTYFTTFFKSVGLASINKRFPKASSVRIEMLFEIFLTDSKRV